MNITHIIGVPDSALKTQWPRRFYSDKELQRPGDLALKFITWQPILLLLFLLALWFFTSDWIQATDPSGAVMGQGIWMLVILSLIAFLLLLALCLWLLHLFWLKTGLPPLSTMVSQFKTLLLWQQLSFCFASLSLLLLAASACLIAIC